MQFSSHRRHLLSNLNRNIQSFIEKIPTKAPKTFETAENGEKTVLNDIPDSTARQSNDNIVLNLNKDVVVV